jgi:hypothetical protein
MSIKGIKGGQGIGFKTVYKNKWEKGSSDFS